MGNSDEKNRKRLKDISHLFFSSVENKKESDIEDKNFYTVAVSDVGIGSSLISAYMIAEKLKEAKFHIYIISSNPYGKGWKYLESKGILPPYEKNDIPMCYKLSDRVELALFSKEELSDKLMNLHSVSGLAYEKVALLFDMEGFPDGLKEEILRNVGDIVLVAGVTIEYLRLAYKEAKYAVSINNGIGLDFLLNKPADKYFVEFLKKEYLSGIVDKFLNPVNESKFIGCIDGDEVSFYSGCLFLKNNCSMLSLYSELALSGGK